MTGSDFMNHRSIFGLPWLLLAAAHVANSAAASTFEEIYCQNTAITPVPATPQAYAPFRLEIVTNRGADPGTLRSVDIAGNEIRIKHQNSYERFDPSPLGQMIVHLPGLAPGHYVVKSQEFDVTMPGTHPECAIALDVAEAPSSRPVYAIYLENHKRYFLTASESGRDTPASHVVDAGFNAWPAEGPAPEAARPVCRFYSGLVNSHFYTASTAECESLKPSDTWAYEGIAFRALVPTARACPPGSTPVWRLFNNRAAQLDSNHRFVASEGIYHAMMADGWTGEGVAFCSPG